MAAGGCAAALRRLFGWTAGTARLAVSRTMANACSHMPVEGKISGMLTPRLA